MKKPEEKSDLATYKMWMLVDEQTGAMKLLQTESEARAHREYYHALMPCTVTYRVSDIDRSEERKAREKRCDGR